MKVLLSAPLAPQPMHAPDGFFSVWLSLVGWTITIVMVALAIRNTRTQLGERQIPLMGIIAATIFAGQMLNFTIPGGTSGHLLGGALAAIILGPWAAVLVMTSVIAIQALLFQDGGLLVMGLNIFICRVFCLSRTEKGVERERRDTGRRLRGSVALTRGDLGLCGC